MKSFRLLPVVIVAGLALLVLKGGALLTDGGYIFSGISAAQAAGDAEEPAVGTAITLPSDATLTDESPTLQDPAPTLPLGEEDEAAAATETHGDGTAAAEPEAVKETDCPAIEGEGDTECADAQQADAADRVVPMVLDGAGEEVPMVANNDPDNEAAVLARLGERRDELDAREEELDMRLALIEAAEQRVDERTAALEQLEARIDAMVEEKRILEGEQFVALVTMYESMKARDAAAIFDQMEMPVMLRVARAMSPRKMAPILAEMDPLRARDLTTTMAVDQVEDTIELSDNGIASLPQIVGQ